MSSIKLLSFPFLIFSKIVRSMGIMELFELSQVSRRVLNLLKLSRIPVARSVNVLIGKMNSIFFYEFGSSTKIDFAIDFVEKPQSITGQMKINNICIDVSKNTEKRIIYCKSSQFEVALVPLLTHLDKIFFQIKWAIGIELNVLNTMREVLSHSVFKKCRYLQIRSETEALSNEDCEYLLERTHPTFGITIRSNLDLNFNYKNILHFSRLSVHNLGKMPLEDLKELDSEIAYLKNHQFTETDINQFLHHWIKGNNKKLRHLHLDGFKEAPDWDILLKDIVYTECNARERERYYKSKYTNEMETIDCENGRDFRNKDGQLATVVHYSKFLVFLVWNDRFPE
ncbi:hypothetical protein CRE_24153 [Caenorhabditis remanei]|uniref:F-box domain-containing protein n=1 Tax=Caenorhabditis remanei TaxID=31234 RepID=E3N440_CAERE|nr:hypothetical protein CRE_24153 [Caenorhabditis remanei]